MEEFTKKDLLLILNIYQFHINQFVNISQKDLDDIYLKIPKMKEFFKKQNKLLDKNSQFKT